VNQILQKLADEETVFWVDFGHKFITSDGRIPRELMPDYLHLSTKAYGIWAESIEPRLAAVLGETPVKATAAVRDLSGEWTATMPGPNQEPVDLPFTLKQDGGKLTGKFERPDGRAMRIEDGSFSWRVKRDRPNGGFMVYEMSGRVEDGRLKGTTRTTMEGNPINLEWTAKRR
jgi:hypothetical protein